MSTGKTRKNVVYLHHTRDRDGDIVFYFQDRQRGDTEPLLSSPVTGIKRCLSAVLDGQQHGALSRYLIITQNTEYEVQIPRDKADHLAKELGDFSLG